MNLIIKKPSLFNNGNKIRMISEIVVKNETKHIWLELDMT